MATAIQKRLEALEARAAVQHPDPLKQFEGKTDAQIEQEIILFDGLARRMAENLPADDPQAIQLRESRAEWRRLGIIKD
jgi:hypothetical protein